MLRKELQKVSEPRSVVKDVPLLSLRENENVIGDGILTSPLGEALYKSEGLYKGRSTCGYHRDRRRPTYKEGQR